MSQLTSIRVLGVHPFVPKVDELETARAVLWGDDLEEDELDDANTAVREHFTNLCLIEIEVEPPDCDVAHVAISQVNPDQPSSSWQAPWDERLTGVGRWAFFMHFVNPDQPLDTPIGLIPLPKLTPTPPHLLTAKYHMTG